MTKLLRLVGVAGYLSAMLMAASAPAGAAPLERAGSAQPASCPAARPVFADFDQNGIADRVDWSGGAAIRLLLNGRTQLALVQAVSVCRLIVVDFDYDTDPDLIAITTRGELLVWRNEGGELVRVSPRHRASHTNRAWTTRQWSPAPESAGLNGRNLAGDVAVVRAHAPPSTCSAISLAPSALRSISDDSSASRAPPSY